MGLGACGGGSGAPGDAVPGGPDAAPIACTDVSACPPAPACHDVACEAQQCVYPAAAAGTSCGEGGDACEVAACDGAGACVTAPVVCSDPPVAEVPRDCVGTFPVALGGACNTTCDPVAGCQYQTIDVPCPDPDTALPQTLGYQVVLRNYLAAQSAAAYDVPAGDVALADLAALTDDELFRLWLATHYDGSVSGLPNYRMLRQFPSTAFTLAAIEGSTPPATQVGTEAGADPLAALFYWQWAYAGNPYAGAAGALRRAFALTAADLMLMDAHGAPTNLDNASGALLNYGYVGSVLRTAPGTTEVVDACTQAAFNVGVRRVFDRYEARNVGNGNGNMLIAQAEGYAFMADALGDAPTRVRASAKIAAQLDAICDPAGFCLHQGGGFDPYYEGWSENVLTSGALRSGWAVLTDAEAAFYRLRSRTSLPQPPAAAPPDHAPMCRQATAFAPATPFGDCTNGGDYNDSRDYGIAMLFDDAAYLAAGGIPGEAAWPGAAADPRQAMIDDITSSRGLARAVSFQNGDAPGAPTPWAERHYPRGLSSAVLFYPPGGYARIQAALAADPERALLPALRSADFVESFGATADGRTPQVTVGKFGGAAPWAAVIHTGVIDTFTDGGGFGGGALVSLWTAAQGHVVYGWNIGRNYGGDYFRWGNLAQWPAHALSGQVAGGPRFSTARIGQPTVTQTIGADHATIDVEAELRDGKEVEAPLAAPLRYHRTFALDGDGLTVTTTLTPVGAAPMLSALFETIPLLQRFYRYDGGGELEADAAEIRFIVDGVPQVGGATPVADVDAVQITRFGETVAIEFATPQTVALVATLDPADDLAPLPDVGPLRQQYPVTTTLHVVLQASVAPLAPTTLAYTLRRR